MTKFRILRSERAWWVLSGTRVSRFRDDPTVGDAVSLRREVVAALSQAGHRAAEDRVNAYGVTVLTSTDCNLRCPYCFQNESLEGAQVRRIRAAALSPSRARDIARFAEARMRSADLTSIELLLFGGEPLMNLEGCLSVIGELSEVGDLTTSMTTNGVLLRGRRLSRLLTAGPSSVQVTLDGAQLDHDSLRKRVGGSGTYRVILSNLAATVEAGLEVTLRVNVTNGNAAGIDALLDDLVSALPAERVGLYLAPVTDPGVGFGDAALRRDRLVQNFVGWYGRAAQSGFRVGAPSVGQFCTFCTHSDGRYGFVVGPDGTLYSSWETAGKPEFAVGDVRTGYDAEVGSRWQPCGFATSTQTAAMDLRAFTDRVDAARLEALYPTLSGSPVSAP